MKDVIVIQKSFKQGTINITHGKGKIKAMDIQKQLKLDRNLYDEPPKTNGKAYVKGYPVSIYIPSFVCYETDKYNNESSASSSDFTQVMKFLLHLHINYYALFPSEIQPGQNSDNPNTIFFLIFKMEEERTRFLQSHPVQQTPYYVTTTAYEAYFHSGWISKEYDPTLYEDYRRLYKYMTKTLLIPGKQLRDIYKKAMIQYGCYKPVSDTDDHCKNGRSSNRPRNWGICVKCQLSHFSERYEKVPGTTNYRPKKKEGDISK